MMACYLIYRDYSTVGEMRLLFEGVYIFFIFCLKSDFLFFCFHFFSFFVIIIILFLSLSVISLRCVNQPGNVSSIYMFNKPMQMNQTGEKLKSSLIS